MERGRQDMSDDDGDPHAHQQERRGKGLDLSELDQKSVKIMVMLMLFLLENNISADEFFEPVIYQQNVKSKNKAQVLEIMKSEDFFAILQERGIRSKATEHQNLKEFLQLSAQHPDLLALKSVKKTLEQMAENEDFMDAIREDIMAAQEADPNNMGHYGEEDGYSDEGEPAPGGNQITTQEKMISGQKPAGRPAHAEHYSDDNMDNYDDDEGFQ